MAADVSLFADAFPRIEPSERSAASCCPTFAAGFGVHYSNCPNYDPVADAERLPAALAELDRRTGMSALRSSMRSARER